jgi:hypothetical protein
MPEGETVYYSDTVETIFGATARLRSLFAEIKRLHGSAEAEKMLKDIVSPKQSQVFRNWEMLARLDRMAPEPDHRQLARLLAKENETLPPDEKWGNGSVEVASLRTHIVRWKNKREQGLKDGTWRGPGASTTIARGYIEIRTS